MAFSIEFEPDALRVMADEAVIYVVAVGKREDLAAYRKAKKKLG